MKIFKKAEPVAEAEQPKADAAKPKAIVAPELLTDEGVPYEALDTQTILNLSRDHFDARRRELHLGGALYHHVSDTAMGRWVYRHDA